MSVAARSYRGVDGADQLRGDAGAHRRRGRLRHSARPTSHQTMTAPNSEPTSTPGDGMVLSSLAVRNFRSCYETTIPFRPDVTVLVGENNSGKSNVIDALRLVLAPLGARRTRYFEVTDLSFGREAETVEMIATFDSLTAIQRGHYTTALNVADMTAIYTTRYAVDPERPTRSRPVTTAGPGDGPDSEPAKREELCHVYLEPLRDAQRELDSSSSRRLTTIIEYLHEPSAVAEFVESANAELRKIEGQGVVTHTQEAIARHLTDLTEPVRAQQMGVQFTDYKLHRLATALRLKMAEAGVDLADLADSGLGYANILYVATVLLQLRAAQDAELTVLLVEEPEAHLHPQMQAVFLDYLRGQAEATTGSDDTLGPAGRIQVVVTTHSPIIASSVPVENVVVLRSRQIAEPTDGGAEQTRTATAAVPVARLGLSTSDSRKLGQYLDATKAALLFGTRVILVEGVSEAVLLPILGRRLYSGDDDDSTRRRRAVSGLTIVNIGSVDFEPYIHLLLGTCEGLSILDRLIVVTDTDPAVPSDDAATGDPPDDPLEPGTSAPRSRLERLLELAAVDPRLHVRAATYTLEADLLAHAQNEPVLRAAFLAQKPRSMPTWQTFLDAPAPAEAFYRRLRRADRFIVKGQFAHDVALAVQDGAAFTCPGYLRQAVEAALEL